MQTYHDCTPRKRRARYLLAAAVLLVALLCILGIGGRIERQLTAQSAAALRQTVLDAAVQCYAVEGAYPESLAHLEQEYGLQINRARFIVTYSAFAENLLPDVNVLEKGY